MTISVRDAVRVFCVICALLLGMLGVIIVQADQAARYRRRLEYGYLRAIQEASSSMNALTANLQKSAAAGSTAQIAELSAKVWNEAGIAKTSLSGLPSTGEPLDETYRFLSQVGDYSLYLSRKCQNGQELSAEEREAAGRFVQYAKEMSGRMQELERKLSSGEVSLEEFLGDGQAAAPVRLAALDENLEGYPKLIYDGPFSDHLLDREPVFTKGRPAVSQDDARAVASRYTGLAPSELLPSGEENSNMPCYLFAGGEFSAAVTKSGGYVAYLLCARLPGEQVLTVRQAREAAARFLDGNEIYQMSESYYELSGGVLTVNFAAEQNGVVCYPDLIQVGVAMDNGQVLFYDARGYLLNHRDRLLPEPVITSEDARELVGGSLTVQAEKLAVIPTPGGNEAFCHEFRCRSDAGGDVLVYINAETGAEEQILLLIESENGVLTV